MILTFRKHRFFFLCFGATSFAVLFWAINTIAYQTLIISQHTVGQNRLLDYVIELRNELKAYRILPYALADNPTLLSFMEEPNGDQDLKKQLQRQLEDLTHVSKTKDWFIISNEGKLLISSEQSPNFHLEEYFHKDDLRDALKNQQGESILISGYSQLTKQTAHLLLAPVYKSTGLVGAVAVRIDIGDLIEKWSSPSDLVAISDQNNLIFLATKQNIPLNKDWLSSQSEVQFFNLTKANTYQLNDHNYLLQNVVLDDLKWQIHYLSDLKSIHKRALIIAFISLGAYAFIFVFWLYRRERSLKLDSKRENEELIAKSDQLQRVLIENTHVGLLQLTSKGKISFINPMGLRYFGQPSQISSQHLSELLPDCSANTNVLTFIKSIDNAENNNLLAPLLEQEVVLQKDLDQTFPALMSISPLISSHSKGYLVTLIDISKRKRAELSLLEVNSRLEERVLERTKELEVAQKELLRTEKLAAIGQMSTAIAHELNQPLTGIKTLAYTAELLLKRQNTEQALKTLIDLEALVGRMQSLTSELKVLAYRRPEQLSPTSVKDAVKRAIKSLGEETHDASWTIELDESDLVMAEPTRLERIFSNLISNSIQACVEQNIRPVIHIHSEHKNNLTIIRYQDNGPGIDQNKLVHIFEPFFTTKPIGKGLGLGLAISANLAKDMNGTLSAHHNKTHNLMFQLTLQKA